MPPAAQLLRPDGKDSTPGSGSGLRRTAPRCPVCTALGATCLGVVESRSQTAWECFGRVKSSYQTDRAAVQLLCSLSLASRNENKPKLLGKRLGELSSKQVPNKKRKATG